jgi:hypothetical protein
MDDLWPKDIKGESGLKAPVAILREQGALLGERTKNIVIGEVRPVNLPTGLNLRLTHPFSYDFCIKGTALGYSYSLFFISYPITLYPVFFIIDDDDLNKELGFEHGRTSLKAIKAINEEKFKDYLKRIFNSEKSRRIISAILAQTEQSTI